MNTLKLCKNLVAAFGLLIASCHVASSQEKIATDTFVGGVVPFLKAHCYECHNADEPEGGIAFDKYNKAIEKNYVEFQKLEKLETIQLDVEEFDRINQQNWFIPDEYKNLDIKSYVLDRTPAHAIDRVNEELNLYDKYNIIDVLKVCIYIIDTLRKNNIVWGVGRGSSVASYVLYIIGVHKVDSIKYELDIYNNSCVTTNNCESKLILLFKYLIFIFLLFRIYIKILLILYINKSVDNSCISK